jgi:hypothetical protein
VSRVRTCALIKTSLFDGVSGVVSCVGLYSVGVKDGFGSNDHYVSTSPSYSDCPAINILVFKIDGTWPPSLSLSLILWAANLRSVSSIAIQS